MKRKEAAALLELMRRQQRDEVPIPPLDPRALAKCYVKIITELEDRSRSPAGR